MVWTSVYYCLRFDWEGERASLPAISMLVEELIIETVPAIVVEGSLDFLLLAAVRILCRLRYGAAFGLTC